MSAFWKAPAAFAAAVIVVCGVLYLPRHQFYFAQTAYRDFFELLPATLELIIASVVLALLLAAVCTLLSHKSTAWIGVSLAALLFFFMCIPLFWLALLAQLSLAVQGVHLSGFFVQFPVAGFAQDDSFHIADRFAHLALPATLLAFSKPAHTSIPCALRPPHKNFSPCLRSCYRLSSARTLSWRQSSRGRALAAVFT